MDTPHPMGAEGTAEGRRWAARRPPQVAGVGPTDDRPRLRCQAGAGPGGARLVGQAEPPSSVEKGRGLDARALHGPGMERTSAKGVQASRDIPLNTLRPFGKGMGITGLTPAPFPQTQPRGVDPSGPDSGGRRACCITPGTGGGLAFPNIY